MSDANTNVETPRGVCRAARPGTDETGHGYTLIMTIDNDTREAARKTIMMMALAIHCVQQTRTKVRKDPAYAGRMHRAAVNNLKTVLPDIRIVMRHLAIDMEGDTDASAHITLAITTISMLIDALDAGTAMLGDMEQALTTAKREVCKIIGLDCTVSAVYVLRGDGTDNKDGNDEEEGNHE